MANASNVLSTGSPVRPAGRTLMIFVKEAKFEFLKNLRLPMYFLSTILFPVMFYVLFGLLMGRQNVGTVSVSAYLIATYGTFGVMGASLFGTAAGLAAERGLGWLQVKRASPMPPAAYFFAKIIMSMTFSSVVVSLLLLLGLTFGGVHMSLVDSGRMLATLVAGCLPFCAMGLALGFFAGPNSAPAAINLIYLPLSFFSGLWIPFMFLPKVLREIARFLPPYHLSQLALQVIGGGQHESNWSHWEVLIGFTMICLGIAYFGSRRDEGKMYG